MKLRVENAVCSGHGRCYTRAPEVFEPDSDGFCDRRDEIRDIPPALEATATTGAHSCPEGAITILGD
ncbi:ferredoxin [Nocardia vaccinii]|uniref:ferredoxin n=1 Tax=Nocardia vaccinii TaxID=1822 RepID=UPI000A078130